MIEPFSPLSATPQTIRAEPRRRLWPWMLLAGFLGFGAGVLATVVLGVVLTYSMGSMLTVEFDDARAAVVGEPFVVGLLIGHDDAETLQFNDLDVPDEFFDNFKIESISPPASPDSPVGGFGAQTYCYEIDIPPGEQRRVELTVVATRAGKHSMTFDVCSSYVCSTIWRTVEVKAPE